MLAPPHYLKDFLTEVHGSMDSWVPAIARRYVHSSRIDLIITLSLADRRDSGDTRSKRPLARNPDVR